MESSTISSGSSRFIYTFIMSQIPSTSHEDDTWVPEGFVLVMGPNNQKYVVPEYCVPDLDQKYLSNKKKENSNANNAQGTVSYLFIYSFCTGTCMWAIGPLPCR